MASGHRWTIRTWDRALRRPRPSYPPYPPWRGGDPGWAAAALRRRLDGVEDALEVEVGR